MSVLDQVIELRNRGVSEREIMINLREQGISPGAIADALGQAQIKNAVSSESMNGNNEELEPSIMMPEQEESLPTEGSLSDEDLTPPSPSMYQMQNPSRAGFVPLHREVAEEEYAPQQEAYSPYQPYLSPETQQSPEYEYPQQTADTDTIIEIAEQVFSEKIKLLQKHLEDLNEFKVLMQSKVENVSERLKRIEGSIDRLQAEILEKVGSYGRGFDSIQKEMSMMQDSFGKMVGNLADKAEHKHHEHHAPPTHLTHPQSPQPSHQHPRTHPQSNSTPSHKVHRIEKKTTVIHKSGKKHSKKKK